MQKVFLAALINITSRVCMKTNICDIYRDTDVSYLRKKEKKKNPDMLLEGCKKSSVTG